MNSGPLAVRLMIAQGVLFAGETMIIHRIGGGASVAQLAFLRGAAGIVLALIVAREIGLAVVRTRQLPLQLMRGAVSLLYLWVMMYSFGHLPLADATAISYTQSAYIAAFSALILGEAVSRSRWTAAALGIFGALLIVRPAFAAWSPAYLVALLGTSLNGLSFVLNRYLQRGDSEATTMFYTNLVPVLGNLPLLAFSPAPAPEALLWLPLLLLLGPVGVYCGIVALKYADASSLGPYTLVRLLVTFVGGIVIFRELPDLFSALGAAVIVASCALAYFSPTRWRFLPGVGRLSKSTSSLRRSVQAG